MLFAILTVVLAVGPVQQTDQPTPEQIQAARTWLRQAFLDAATEVDEFKQKTKERFDLEPSKPRTGLEMEIVTLPADETGHPIRHTMVTGVFAGSAAEKAGIKPGDRIAAIGDEVLDHETGKAVLLYLSNYAAGAIPLTVEREGASRKVSLVPQPLACLRVMFQQFPEAKWLDIWNQSQTMLRDEAKLLENPKLTVKDLEHSNEGYQAMMMLWSAAFENMAKALDERHHPACTVSR